VYNQDYEDEKRIPDSVKTFRNELEMADAVLFAVPEYNGSIPGTKRNHDMIR
jgi:chromate reductase